MAHGNWITKSHMIKKAAVPAALAALDAASCYGDPAADANFAAHLSAARSAAQSIVNGFIGAATCVDISIAFTPDSGPGSSDVGHVGGSLAITVSERY